MVTNWVKEISVLSDIALSQPQAAYACYTSGYQHKFSFFLRTIPGIEKYLNPLEEIIRHRLLPAITGGHIVNDDERTLLSLPPRFGGLGIINPIERAPTELRNSESITASLKNVILRKNIINEEEVSLTAVKNNRRQQNLEKLKNVQSRMTPEAARLNESNMESGVSNWLTTLPIKELNYDLNKEQFFDALRLRYDWTIPKLPSECVCGSKFNVTHALSCKKGGYVSLRHNEIRDIIGKLLEEVCKDVRKEPLLLRLSGERIHQNGISSHEARLDVSAVDFWTPGQRVFLDVRVLHLNALRYRVQRLFYQRLSEMISEKRNIRIAEATKFIRTKISFSLLRSSTLLCLRGCRSFARDHQLTDMELGNVVSLIRS